MFKNNDEYPVAVIIIQVITTNLRFLNTVCTNKTDKNHPPFMARKLELILVKCCVALKGASA